MRVDTYMPALPLRPFVKAYVIVDCAESALNSMLPDTSLILGFRYKGVTHYKTRSAEEVLPFAVVAGLRRTVQYMRDGKDTGNFLVILQPASAGAILREPLHQFFGEVLSLDKAEGFRSMDEVEDRLCSAHTDQQRIRAMDRFLMSRLAEPRTDLAIQKAMEIIRSEQGNIRIKELSKRLYMSVDSFEKRFRRSVGASPKQICNTVRMTTIIRQLPRRDMLDAALACGYYDQAHFTNAFKNFTGMTPTAFLKSTEKLQDAGNRDE